MFEWVLNRLCTIMSEAYLECSQKSMVEHFCKNSLQLLPVNYFCKRAPSQIFNWNLNRLWAVYVKHISGLEIRSGKQSMTAEFYILTVENLLFVIKVIAHFFVTKVALKLIVIAGERLHM